MKKIFLVLVSILFLTSFVSAAVCSMQNSSNADVVYIVLQNSEIKQTYLDAIQEVELNYHVLCSNNVKNYNFSNNRLILINNEYFSNWKDIPINNFSAIVINGRNIANWGWTTQSTKASQNSPFHVNLNKSNEITNGLNNDIMVYSEPFVELYYLDKRDAYVGIETIASEKNNEGIVVGLAREGTTLTKQGYPSTKINANTIFFGVHESPYWTNETKTLFKNSLLFLAGSDKYNLELNSGRTNLVSFPLILNSYDLNELLIENPEITSVKTYDNSTGEITTASEILNNKGYFIQISEDKVITISGKKPQQTQNVNLGEGMNLVGISSLSTRTFEQLNLPDEVIEISKRNDDGRYTISTKYGGVWFNQFELEPGKGYWFKTNAATTWSYSP